MSTRPILIVVAALASPIGWSHHSAGSLYHLDRSITVEGTVREFRFVNPHVRIYVEVVTPTGAAELWLAEGQSKNVLVREGWTGSELVPGSTIRLTGNPSRDGTPAIQWATLRLADGTELGGGTSKDFRAHIERLRGR